ncbi:ribonuclease J [Mycoplasmopsis ciconiae]|uniref:Ribonuclease J n=1 Tax=Mycoplasmopsis ciconiae TaxID=561067 RepID=A0ABU7MLR2_9BACT|nr:ribonuclease J [Mycoplasmopsis ciconiae]
MTPTKIIPLGGVQEIGKASLLVEHDNHIFIIDAGIKFADTFTTGIKGIIPNYDYLNNPDKKIEGLFITHGHEDHIGGVVYLVKQTPLKKIFAPRIAIQYLKSKFEEHKITKKIEFIEIDKKDKYYFGQNKCCMADFWTAQHSIPDAFGVLIHTPDGKLMCTGDFRFDYTPIGNYTDFARLDQIGKDGLTVLLSDSTNAMRPYHSPSESDIVTDIEKHMQNAKRKIIITAFASNLTRVKVMIDIAVKMNKKILVFGRSMIQGIKIGRKLGYIDVPQEVFADKKQLSQIKESDLVILTTGSQGEQLAALSRMSYGKHPSVKINKGDVVIFSSSPIPGNRMTIELLINRLYKLGAIIKENGPDGYLHTSGHAYKHEHDKVFQLTKPKYFLPYHGEYRMSVVHGQSAIRNGVDPKNVIIPELGKVYLMDKGEVKVTNQKIDFGPVYIDGTNVLKTTSTQIYERSKLANSGFVNIVIIIDVKNNSILGRPQLVSRGAFYVKNSGELIDESKRIAHGAALHYIKNTPNWNVNVLEKMIIDRLSNLYHKQKRRDPVIIPTIVLINDKKDKKVAWKVQFQGDSKKDNTSLDIEKIKNNKRTRIPNDVKKIVKDLEKHVFKKDDIYEIIDEDDEE